MWWKPLKTKGFRYKNDENNENEENDNNTNNINTADISAILIRYSEKLSNVERILKNLMSKISNVLNITISIGLSKINENDKYFNFEKWINKSIDFMLM